MPRTAIQHLMEQRLLLEIEYNAEKEAFRQLTEQIGLQRRIQRGDAWYPIKPGRTYWNSLNQLCIEVFQTTDDDIDHNFESGRPVMFFRLDPPSALRAIATGTVSYVDGNRMVVAVPDDARVVDIERSTEPVGVQLSFDETSYKTMFDALQRVIRAKDNRLAYLRELFYNPQIKASAFSFSPLRFPYLNDTQQQAVNAVLRAKDVSIVHGPPGTGKTTTLVEAIRETLMRESQVLVCAQSNMAVDWISERLVDRGIPVLRIGNPTRVNDKMLSFTYERRFEAHPDYPALWAIRKALRELRAARSQHRGRSDSYHQKIDRLKSRATELEIRIHRQLFDEARVVASTLVGSGHRLLQGMTFATLFVDEAAQALEAACWIPLQKAHRIILAGDHCQLPPTVKSLVALHGGLGTTLMERIVATHPETVTLLRVQYRMNDAIMRFPSRYFYHGQVESAPDVRFRGILDYDRPIEWIDTTELDAPEEFVGTTFGRINRQEATLTLDLLERYFEKIGRQRVLDENIDVGIITPYRAQVQLLRRMLRQRATLKPFRHLVTVRTVDGFQGQERDIIILSLVRANKEGQIGFLRDLRRMNVAITRARMKLIILGNAATLTRHSFYKSLFDYIQEL